MPGGTGCGASSEGGRGGSHMQSGRTFFSLPTARRVWGAVRTLLTVTIQSFLCELYSSMLEPAHIEMMPFPKPLPLPH